MVNRERGELPIKAGKQIYVFRMGLTALAKLETLLSTPEKRYTLTDVRDVIARIGNNKSDPSLHDLLNVVLAGMQEYHGDRFKSIADVERLIEECGGLDALNAQLTALSQSISPDQADLVEVETERRPQMAQTR